MTLEPLKLGDNRGEHIAALITAVDELRKMVEDQNVILRELAPRLRPEYKDLHTEILGHMNATREQLDLLR